MGILFLEWYGNSMVIPLTSLVTVPCPIGSPGDSPPLTLLSFLHPAYPLTHCRGLELADPHVMAKICDRGADFVKG